MLMQESCVCDKKVKELMTGQFKVFVPLAWQEEMMLRRVASVGSVA